MYIPAVVINLDALYIIDKIQDNLLNISQIGCEA